jgi:hypothetical protein
VLSKALTKCFNDKIKKLFYNSVEKVLQNNWHYHLNYLQFIGKLLPIVSKEEASTDVFSILVKIIRAPSSSLPAKKHVATIMAQQIATIPNYQMRYMIQDLMLKEVATSQSVQQRIVYLFFLDALLPFISRKYYKATFHDTYLSLKEEETI